MYDVKFSGAAHKYFKKIKDKDLKKSFKTVVDELAKDPYIGKLKTGDLAGIYCVDVYYKKTNYEIAYRIYEISEQMAVVILAGTRENFYEELKRYMK